MKIGRVAAACLLLAAGLASAQDSVVYYRGPSFSGQAVDACVNGPVYADSPTAVAQLKVNTNNGLASCAPGSQCYDPVTLVGVTETSYTVQSVCNGAQFTHAILKIVNPKQDPQPCCEGNPVNPRFGAKFQEEVDFPGTAAGELNLTRFYNSARDPEKSSGFGESWTHGYMRRLAVNLGTASSPVPYDAAFARRPSGQILVFKKISGVWQPDGDVIAALVDVLNGSGQVIGRRMTIGEADEVVGTELGVVGQQDHAAGGAHHGPLHRGLGRIGLGTLALEVHEAQAVLRERMALLGGGAHPPDRDRAVLHHAQSHLRHHRDAVLRLRIAPLRERLQQLHGARELLRLEGGDAARQLHIQS